MMPGKKKSLEQLKMTNEEFGFGITLERRPKWPESRYTKTTLNFHKKVFTAPNLLGIFAGHVYRKSIEVITGTPQIVTDDNASGGYLEFTFLPMYDQDKKLI